MGMAMSRAEKPSVPVVFAGIFLFGVLPASEGALYFLQFMLMVATLIGSPLAVRLLSRLLFGKVPLTEACLWPADPVRDEQRGYWALMLRLAAVWLAASLVFFDSIWALRTGLGDQWSPFTRTIHVTKSGPYSEYVIFDIALFVSGFFFLSGFVWFPMYAFFERLTMSGRVSIILAQRTEKA